MKNLILILVLFLGLPANAQIEYDTQKVQFVELVNLFNIRCVLPLGRPGAVKDRVYTELPEVLSIYGRNPAIEMEPTSAILEGCNVNKMDVWVRAAGRRYNHAKAQFTVVKETARHPRIIGGKCTRPYREQIEFDFGYGLIFKTEKLGKLKPATGC